MSVKLERPHNFIPVKVGDYFGRWRIISDIPHLKGNGKILRQHYHVRCSCGQESWVYIDNLRRGLTKSCGCLRKDLGSPFRTHGMSKSPIYAIWNMIQQRINLPTSKAFKYYGGRGIDMDPRWLKFEQFYSDVGSPPFKKASLDRIDNNRGYWPDNVRWATKLVQGRNISNNTRYEYLGHALMISEWAAITGIKHQTIASRLYLYGWTIEKSLTTPVRRAGHCEIIFTPQSIPIEIAEINRILQEELDEYMRKNS